MISGAQIPQIAQILLISRGFWWEKLSEFSQNAVKLFVNLTSTCLIVFLVSQVTNIDFDLFAVWRNLAPNAAMAIL